MVVPIRVIILILDLLNFFLKGLLFIQQVPQGICEDIMSFMQRCIEVLVSDEAPFPIKLDHERDHVFVCANLGLGKLLLELVFNNVFSQGSLE